MPTYGRARPVVWSDQSFALRDSLQAGGFGINEFKAPVRTRLQTGGFAGSLETFLHISRELQRVSREIASKFGKIAGIGMPDRRPAPSLFFQRRPQGGDAPGL